MTKKGKHAKTNKSKNTKLQDSTINNDVAVKTVTTIKENNSKEAQELNEERQAIENAITPALSSIDIPNNSNTKSTHLLNNKVAISFIVIIFLCISVYLIGALTFTRVYAPNTKICGVDVSFKQPYELAYMLKSDFDSYKIIVRGEGVSFEIDAKNTNINADTETIAINALNSFDTWKWPIALFQERDLNDLILANLDEGNLSNIVNAKIRETNKNKTEAKDACIAWNTDKEKFEIIGEVYGNQLDELKVKETILAAIVNLSNTVTLNESDRISPTIYKNDKRFNKALNQANIIGSTNFHIFVNDIEIAYINGEVAQKWIEFDNPFTVRLDEGKIEEWSYSITDNLNTVDSERAYTRPDGKTITVSGGTYGWQVNVDEANNQIIEAIKTGSNENVIIQATQVAAIYTKKGEKDWSNRYIDIDISEQHARLYNDNGDLVWESDIVTGKPEKEYATPQGVYSINRKQSPSRLKGPMVDGKAEWDSVVQYWMPFVGNLIGLHDATWQSAFGGQRYSQGYGSHGCVNLPLNAAEELYSAIIEGDVVVVHY